MAVELKERARIGTGLYHPAPNIIAIAGNVKTRTGFSRPGILLIEAAGTPALPVLLSGISIIERLRK